LDEKGWSVTWPPLDEKGWSVTWPPLDERCSLLSRRIVRHLLECC